MAITVNHSDYCGHCLLSWTNPPGTVFNTILRGTTVIYNGSAKSSHDDYYDAGSYSYTIEAYDEYWEFIDDGSTDGTIYGSPGQAPQNLNATNNLCDKITISWNNPSFNSYEEPTKVNIKRDGNLITQLDYPATSYDDSPNPGYYSYEVYYSNDCGNSPSATSVGTRLTSPQYSAQNFAAGEGDCYKVVLEWTNPNEPSYSQRSGWKIYRNGQYIGVAGANDTRYDDYVSPGTYTYKIQPYNSCGDGPYSSEDQGISLGPPTINVSNLSGGLSGGPSIKLTYTAGNGTYRKIYRKINNGSYVLYDTTTNNSTYTDNNVSAGNTYYYKLQEANSCGDATGYSNEISVYVYICDEISSIAIASNQITDSLQYINTFEIRAYANNIISDSRLSIARQNCFLGDSSGNIYKLSRANYADNNLGYQFVWVSKVFDIFLSSGEDRDLFKTIRRVEIKYRDLGATSISFYISTDGGINWIAANNNPIALEGLNDGKIKSVFADVWVTGKTICFKIVQGNKNENFSLLDLEVDFEVRGFIKQEKY